MTTQKVSSGIIGELLLDEIPYWDVGVCTVKATDHGNIEVRGENDHQVAIVSTDCYTESPLPGEDQTKDLPTIAKRVNDVIEDEHNAL